MQFFFLDTLSTFKKKTHKKKTKKRHGSHFFRCVWLQSRTSVARTAITQQATKFCPNHWFYPPKVFIVKQLQEVLRKSLLTKHSDEVDQKPARLLSARWKVRRGNVGVKQNSQYDSYDPRANTGRLKQTLKAKFFFKAVGDDQFSIRQSGRHMENRQKKKWHSTIKSAYFNIKASTPG